VNGGPTVTHYANKNKTINRGADGKVEVKETSTETVITGGVNQGSFSRDSNTFNSGNRRDESSYNTASRREGGSQSSSNYDAEYEKQMREYYERIEAQRREEHRRTQIEHRRAEEERIALEKERRRLEEERRLLLERTSGSQSSSTYESGFSQQASGGNRQGSR
jgi:hypothetical protein